MAIEHGLVCPSCGEAITMLLDLSVSRQEYIEDCEVCRRPILIFYQSDGEEFLTFDAQTAV